MGNAWRRKLVCALGMILLAKLKPCAPIFGASCFDLGPGARRRNGRPGHDGTFRIGVEKMIGCVASSDCKQARRVRSNIGTACWMSTKTAKECRNCWTSTKTAKECRNPSKNGQGLGVAQILTKAHRMPTKVIKSYPGPSKNGQEMAARGPCTAKGTSSVDIKGKRVPKYLQE